MSKQWGNVDNAANSVSWVLNQLGKSVSDDNKTELFQNTTPDVYATGANVGLFGVSAGEQQAIPEGTVRPTHAGWVLRTEGSGGRAGRITYETIVAMRSLSDDGEDAIFKDYRITINTQPVSSELVAGNAVNFIVGAVTVPSGGTITYRWQRSYPGALAWANVPNTGVFASANSNTTSTLSISDNTDLDGNVFSVMTYVSGGDSLRSANATITVT
jgi:hypothetical protein